MVEKTEVGPLGIEFIAALADSSSAIRFDGRGDGGKVVFEFDRSQVAEVAKLLLYTDILFRVRIEPVGQKLDKGE